MINYLKALFNLRAYGTYCVSIYTIDCYINPKTNIDKNYNEEKSLDILKTLALYDLVKIEPYSNHINSRNHVTLTEKGFDFCNLLNALGGFYNF